MSQQLVVDISPTGNIKIEANGFQGNSCAQATEQLEITLGGNGVRKRDYKPEFSMPASTNQTQKAVF